MISAIYGVNGVSDVKIPAFKGREVFHADNKNDRFTPSVHVVHGNLTGEEAKKILSETKNNNNFVGKGYTANVYKIGNYAIKSPRTDHSDKYWIGVGNGKILKEYAILKKISEISPDIAVKPSGLIQKKGFYHIVEDFIKGSHPYDSKMKEPNLSDLISKLTKLDKNGICSTDLQSSNIFFLKDGSARLIDFGSYSILSDTGKLISSDALSVDLFDIYFNDFLSTNAETKFASSFFNKNRTDIVCDFKNYADNPYLNTKSNISNFEFRSLYTFLREDYVKNPIEVLKKYVKSKGKIYHSGMLDFLKKVDIDADNDYIKIAENSSPTNKIEAKEALKKAIHYEELAKEVLSNPTEEVLKAEAAKIQLKMFCNPDSWHSSIPHEQGLKDAYEQTIEILKENIKKTEGKTKEYFEETLKGIQERFKYALFSEEQLKIPDNENLIKKLFSGKQNTKSQVKKYNIPKIMIFSAFCAAAAKFIEYKHNQNNKDNKNKKH